MKKILLGCSAIVLIGLSIPGYFIAKQELERQTSQGDCKAVEPTVDLYAQVMSPFYQKVIEEKESPGLALLSAAKVEAQLPKLATIHLQDKSLNDDHKIVIANLKLFVTDARDWAIAYQPGSYMKFVSKRTTERPQGFRNIVAGGGPMGLIINHCYYY